MTEDEMMKRFKFGNYIRYPTHIIIDEMNGELNNSEVVDLLNEQHETIERLEKQLAHLEYRFTEYRNKVNKND